MVRLSKKIFSLLLVSFILLGLTTNIVLADTKGEAVIASSKVSISNKLAHFCKSFCVNQTNEDEIIYLNGLMNFNIWFRYATQSNSLGFTPNNLSTYYDFLKKSVLTFNNSYSSVDDTRASLKLNISIDESQYSDLDLYNPLDKKELTSSFPLGIDNEFIIDKKASVEVHQGYVLIIYNN